MKITASDRLALIRLASTMPVGSGERRAILANLSRVSGTQDGSGLVANFLSEAAAQAYGSQSVYDVSPNRRGQFDINVGGTNPIWDVSFTVDVERNRIKAYNLTEDFGQVPFDLWTATVSSTANLMLELFSR